MVDAEYPEFAALLNDVAALLQRPGQQPLSASARAMYFRALQQHPLPVVRAALDAHVKDPNRGRFFPMPADLVAQIEGLAEADGRPGPEEAWAIALRARDEAATVVWTAEMAHAWGAAREVMAVGDEIGARMAFREVYARLVDDARRQRMPASWSASLGFDAEERRQAIQAAVAAGRLPQSELLGLPAPAWAEPLLMLGMNASDQSPAAIEGRRVLAELADRIRNTEAPPSPADTERLRIEGLKRGALLRAREFAAEQGIELDGSPIVRAGDAGEVA